jgi:serine/threonine-protein kinase
MTDAPSHPSWYRTLAGQFFLRQAATILAIVAVVLWVAYHQAARGARAAAGASLTAGSQVLARAFEQQGRSMDAGLEVFTQYSGNAALVERALEAGPVASLRDALVDNLPRLGAEIALVARPDGRLLACSAPGAPDGFPEVGILQMALAPAEAAAAGNPGPAYRGFIQVAWGPAPGVYHAVARPLRAPGGAPLGAMLVGTRLDASAAADLRRLAVAAPVRGEPPPHLALLSHFRTLGTTLDRPGPLDQLLARDPAFLAERARILEARRPGVLALDLDGRPYLGMLTALRGVNALDLEMAGILLMPVDPLLAPFRTVQRAILGAGLAGLALALALSLRSARRVTAPLQVLVGATEALAQGRAPGTLPVLPGGDEVGRLTRAFRSMQAELRAKDELLALLDPVRAPGPEPTPAPGAHDPTAPVARPAPDAPPALPDALREGSVFAGRYRVDARLGQGGMGVVLKVRDLQLDEDVALKVVRPDLAADPAFLDRLKGEIRLARRVSHRYVLRTHDFGEAGGIPFVTMEYLKGTTLRSLLDSRGALPLPLALRIARQLAEGLEAAHGVQVVHRDIKPLNVLFDLRGDVRIMDFGLAVPVAAGGGAGVVTGTPAYMAPEQIRGEPVDGRADLYALGVVLFELCAGVPPFSAPRVADLLDQHLRAPAPDLAERVPDLPGGVAELVAHLLAKRREDRPPWAAEVVASLKGLAAG